jgi:uncharacterized protein (DUF697 family)
MGSSLDLYIIPLIQSNSRKMSEVKKSNRTENADSIIKNHMIWSMGAGLIPVPVADFFAVSAIQLDMIRQLAKIYDIDFEQTKGKAYITTLTGSGLARIGARAVKFIPGIGSILGGITMAALSGGSTYALGEVFKKHFESGGTFLDFDPERLKKYYNEKFEKGKEIAEEYRKSQQENNTQNDNHVTSSIKKDLVSQLKELSEMHKSGILTDEEFEIMKKKVVNS